MADGAPARKGPSGPHVSQPRGKRLREDESDACVAEVVRVLNSHSVSEWTVTEQSKLSSMFRQLADDICPAMPAADTDQTGGTHECCHCSDTPHVCGPPTCEAHTPIWRFFETMRSELKRRMSFSKIQEANGQSMSLQPAAGGMSSLFHADVPTFDVDAFLYDEQDVDALCDEGHVSRQYCTKCKSWKHLAATQFVSNSFSSMQLLFIFTQLISACPTPPTSLVDVGSRLGIVLWAAFNTTSIPRIVGVELNHTFAQLQRDVIAKHKKFAKRVEIAECDVFSEEGTRKLQEADLVCLNNVFEWFAPLPEQWGLWERISAAISRAGQLVLTYPSLEESLLPLATVQTKGNETLGRQKMVEFLAGWGVRPIDTSSQVATFSEMYNLPASEEDQSDDDMGNRELLTKICLYRIQKEG